MDIFRRKKFDEAMFAKNRDFTIRVGEYWDGDIKEATFDYGYIKGDTYKPGGTCAGSAKITFTSIITTFNKLDKVTPEIAIGLADGTYEWVKMGEYFINDIEIDRNRNTTTLDLMDGMFKLNREYVTDLTYPAEIRHVIKEICLKTGIELANKNMGIASMNYRIDKLPEDKKMTFREVLGLSAQMLGMSCFFNREGKLEVKELTDSGIVITADSYFMHGLTKSEIEYQIAGITCKKDKETLTVGLRTGRSLEIENPFMTQSILDDLYHNIKDIRYYPFNLNFQGHLLLDVGQWVTIKTNKGETFKSPVLSQSFNFKGGLRGRISADSKAGNDVQYSYAGTITKKIEQFSEFEKQLQNQIEEADRGFDAKVDQIKKDFNDQIKLAEAKAEENKKALSDEIDRRFHDFSPSGFDEAKAKAEEALKKAGASSLLAQETKQIGLDSIAKLEEFKKQATSAQTALSGDLDALKRTVTSEVNQSSEYRRTTAETLSRMTGQMNGFATKSEVRQDVTGLTETFTKLKTDTNNLISGAKSEITLAKTEFQRTADGLSAKMSAVERYVNQDGQRQESLQRYAREESARQATAVRELVSRDFIGKASYQEDVHGINQRIEEAKKNASDELTTRLANYRQTVDGKFTDISSQVTTYKQFTDGKFGDLSNQIVNNKNSTDDQIENVRNQLAKKVEVTDFQRVKETSQLYERILGTTETGAPDKISRLVMTSEIFQTEVGKYVTDDNNLIVNSMTMNKHTLIGNNNPKADISVNNGIFTIKARGLTSYNWSGFSLPIYVKKIYQGETYTLGFNYRIREYPDSSFAFNVKNHGLNKILISSDIGKNRPPLNEWQEFQKTFTVQEDFAFGEDANYPFYIYLAKNGWIEFKEPILVRGSKTGPYKPSQFDDAYKQTKEAKELAESAQTRAIQVAEKAEEAKRTAEATRTQVTQLAGSYAIQNLNSAGDIISGINLGANGNNRIIGRATHITGETLIDNAVIKSAMIDKLKTANFEAGSVTTNILGAEAVTAEKVKFDTAFIQRLVSQQAFINELFAKQATITKIQSIDFTGEHIKGGKLSSLNGDTDFDLQTGWIEMNQAGVGIKNQFAGRPIQYLIFDQGVIHGKPGSYTALMSNSTGKIAMDDGSAGIQIWNTNDNTTAINLYGDEIAMLYNADDKNGIIINNITNGVRGLGDVQCRDVFLTGYGNHNLKALLNDIYKNIRQLHAMKESRVGYSFSTFGPID